MNARARYGVAAAFGVLCLGAAPSHFGVRPFDLPNGEYLLHAFAQPKTGDLRVRYEQCLFWQDFVHFACPVRWRTGKQYREYVVTDGRSGKRYQRVHDLEGIDGSGGTAYLGFDAAGGRIVIRGREGRLSKARGLQSYSLGPFERNYFYFVYHGGIGRYYLNGWPNQGFPSLFNLCFSRDGRAFAFSIQEGPSVNHEAVIWNGRRSGPEYSWIKTLVLSSDGRTLAFIGNRENLFHVVVNDVESPAYQSADQLRFGPDGRTLSYEAWLPNRDPFFVIGGKQVSLEDAPAWANQEWHGLSLLYLPDTGERRFEFGDVMLPPYLDIRDPRWLPDGGTPVFHVSEKETEFYVKGTQEEKSHRFAWALRVAPHDNCIGYKVRDADEERVVACGLPGRPYRQVGPPVFAPYTNDVAYRANEGGTRPPDSGLVEGGRWFVVANGREGPSYEMVWDPFFDPQLKRFAYYAFKAGRLFLVLSNLD